MPEDQRSDTERLNHLDAQITEQLSLLSQIVGKQPPNEGPWWARLFVTLGAPGALVVFLIAALFGWIPSPIMQMLARLEYNGWQQTRILRTICNNTDNNKADFDRCEPYKSQ